MHVMRGCPEAAERHGAGHVARCTARGAHGRPGPARHPSRQVPARRESSTRPTSAKAFRPFRPNKLWVADVPRKAGGAPFYIHIFFVWGYVAFVTDVHSRRFLGRQNQLPAIVHRSSPGCPPDGRLATNTSGCRSLWPGASLAATAYHTGPSAAGRPYQTAMLSSLLPPSGFTGVGTTQPHSAIGMRIPTEYETVWAPDANQNSQYQSQPATTATRQARLHKTGV